MFPLSTQVEANIWRPNQDSNWRMRCANGQTRPTQYTRFHQALPIRSRISQYLAGAVDRPSLPNLLATQASGKDLPGEAGDDKGNDKRWHLSDLVARSPVAFRLIQEKCQGYFIGYICVCIWIYVDTQMKSIYTNSFCLASNYEPQTYLKSDNNDRSGSKLIRKNSLESIA